MAVILDFKNSDQPKKSPGLRRKLKHGIWNDLNDDEKFLALGLINAFGIKANHFISADIIGTAAEFSKDPS